MPTALMVVIAVVVIAAIAAAGFLLWARDRSQRLRRRFGPEYDHALERHGNRRAAEEELLARAHRRQELDIRPLAPRAREIYRQEWTRVQERFVDSPGAAVEQADRLVTTVMSERGYPTKDFEERVATLSVDHARAMGHYRAAHDISDRAGRQDASTEDLRQAMMHYRALFEDLLAVPEGEPAAPPAGPASGSGEPADATAARPQSPTESPTESPIESPIEGRHESRTGRHRS